MGIVPCNLFDFHDSNISNNNLLIVVIWSYRLSQVKLMEVICCWLLYNLWSDFHCFQTFVLIDGYVDTWMLRGY